MTTQSIELDLSTVVPSLSGPKRPHDRVSLSEMKEDFQKCLDNKVSSCHSNLCVNFENIWFKIVRYYVVIFNLLVS